MKFSYNKFLQSAGPANSTPEQRKLARQLDGRPTFPTVLESRILLLPIPIVGIIGPDGSLYYVPADLCVED